MGFAGPLKAMLRAYCEAVGVGPAMTEAMIEGGLRELPSPYLAGRSPRYAMQHLGSASRNMAKRKIIQRVDLSEIH